MSSEDLKKLQDDLPTGARLKLAKKLDCDPAKITKALHGLVKSKDFMARLQAEANEIMNNERQAVS